MSSSSIRNLEKAQLWRQRNMECAQIILRNQARYPGLPVIWARAVMAKPLLVIEDARQPDGSRWSVKIVQNSP